MKRLLYTFAALPLLAVADTSTSAEGSISRGLARLLQQYDAVISKEPVTNWEQLEKVDPGLAGISAYLKKGSVDEYFSFVPLSERTRFSKGEIIVVQYRSMPWPDALKTEDPSNPNKFSDNPSHQDVRYLVYRENGEYRAERWYEERFQAMLAKTGLTVPPPTPRRPAPPAAKPNPQNENQPIAAVTDGESTPSGQAQPVSNQNEAASQKKTNLYWWPIGLLAVAIVTFFARQRCKKK